MHLDIEPDSQVYYTINVQKQVKGIYVSKKPQENRLK